MLKPNNIIKNSKALFLFISIVITSCSVNDKEAFDIIDEAKKFLSNITNEDQNINDSKSKIEVINTEKSEEVKKIENEKIPQLEGFDETEKKEDTKYQPSEIQKKQKNINSDEVIVSESKLIKGKDEIELLKVDEQIEVLNIDEEIHDTNKSKNKVFYPQINLGVLLPLTGENKEIGNLILNALELALFQTDSKKINLIIEDTEADPKKTLKIFKSLIENDVKLFIGPLYSKSLVAVENYASEKNVKFFALTNNTNLARNGVWIFGINPQQQTKTILDFLISNGNKKIGFLLPDNSYGYLLYDTVQKVLKSKNTLPARVEFFKENIDSQQKAAKKISKGFERYEAYLKEIKESANLDNNDESLIPNKIVEMPLDSIFIGASGQTLTILASQLQYSSVDPKKVTYVGTSSWEDESILQEPALNGAFFSTTTDFLQKEVSKNYSIAYGTEMPKVAMVAYDILSLLSANIKENGDINMQYLLNDNGYIGLRGLFRLKLDGTVERTFQIKTIKKSKFTIYQVAPEFFLN